MKKVLLFLVLGFIAKVNYAQTDSAKLSRPGMIEYSPGGFFRSGKFLINGNEVTNDEMFTKLANYQPSAYDLKEFKKYRDLTYYSAGAALSFLTASLIATGNSSTFKNTSSKVLFGLGMGFIVPEAIFAGKRNRHWRKSVGLYNQQFN